MKRVATITILIMIFMSGCSWFEGITQTSYKTYRTEDNDLEREHLNTALKGFNQQFTDDELNTLNWVFRGMKTALNRSDVAYKDKVLDYKEALHGKLLDPVLLVDLNVSKNLKSGNRIEAKHILDNAIRITK